MNETTAPPRRWLTRHEKAATLREWNEKKRRPVPGDSGGRGFPDPEIIPWCDRLNALRGVCTVQSCAGHEYRDGSRSAGHVWLRLSRELAAEFDRRALELAAREGIEQVARVYAPWGAEVVSITFAGNEHDRLPQSMGAIVSFFSDLARAA